MKHVNQNKHQTTKQNHNLITQGTSNPPLLRIKRLKNSKLEDWVREDQHFVNRMWMYLHERESQ